MVPASRAPQLKTVPPRKVHRPAAPATEEAGAARAKPLNSYRPPAAEPVRQSYSAPADSERIAPSGSNAVVSLLNSAEASGDPNRAAAVLERALRIEPNNPLVWHRLAASRLQQGRFAQAEAVALKSNALATGNSTLRSANWAIVAEARTALGDHEGAAEATRNRRSGRH